MSYRNAVSSLPERDMAGIEAGRQQDPRDAQGQRHGDDGRHSTTPVGLWGIQKAPRRARPSMDRTAK